MGTPEVPAARLGPRVRQFVFVAVIVVIVVALVLTFGTPEAAG